jgi:valyl-tRNA synthetase
MMMGLYFMGDVPFRRVLLHGMVVDETGKKMSKVTGNVIDPLDLIYGAKPEDIAAHASPGAPVEEALAKFAKCYPSLANDIKAAVERRKKGIEPGEKDWDGFPAYGTDAVRMTLSTYAPSNRRIPLSPARIAGNRRFANKIWNAAALTFASIPQHLALDGVAPPAETLFDRWILAQLQKTIAIANTGLAEFRIDEAANELYRFFWTDFCDWYLEVTKPLFREPGAGAQSRVVIAHVLETALRLLHPIMPFITEELWQRMPRAACRFDSIAFGPYPTATDGIADEAALHDMEIFKSVVSAIRSIRSMHGVNPKVEIALSIGTAGEASRRLLTEQAAALAFLTGAPSPSIGALGGTRAAGTAVDVVPAPDGPIEVRVALKGLVTKDEELARIARTLKTLEKDLAVADKKLATPTFLENAPPELVAEVRATREQHLAARTRLEAARKLAEEL